MRNYRLIAAGCESAFHDKKRENIILFVDTSAQRQAQKISPMEFEKFASRFGLVTVDTIKWANEKNDKLFPCMLYQQDAKESFYATLRLPRIDASRASAVDVQKALRDPFWRPQFAELFAIKDNPSEAEGQDVITFLRFVVGFIEQRLMATDALPNAVATAVDLWTRRDSAGKKTG